MSRILPIVSLWSAPMNIFRTPGQCPNALVMFGQGVSEIRGTIGGTTFSRNRGGAYMRNRVTPIDPNSLPQGTMRALIQSLNSWWLNKLTQTERDAWKVYAAAVPVINKLGASISLSGMNWFIGCNAVRQQSGLPRVEAAPVILSVAGVDATASFSALAAADAISYAFDDTLDWLDEDDAAMCLFVSRPQNPTVNYFKGPFRLALTILGDATTAPTTPQSITNPFPQGVGQKVFVRQVIVRADGRYSAEFITSALVA